VGRGILFRFFLNFGAMKQVPYTDQSSIDLKFIVGIVERGDKKDWQSMIRLYGREHVLNAVKNGITELSEAAMGRVCKNFKLKKEDLVCHVLRQANEAAQSGTVKAILYRDIRQKKVIEKVMFSKLTSAQKRKGKMDWKDVMGRFTIIKEA
jgi:hypothetical protein